MTEDGTKARGIIAVCIAVLLGIALIGVFVLNPTERQQSNLNLIIGALIGALSTIVGFYFGSSSGAKALVANQADVLKTAVTAVTGTSNGSALTSAKPTGTPTDPVTVTETTKPPPAEGRFADTAPQSLMPAPEDPRLTDFRIDAKRRSPGITEGQILAAWKHIQPVDIPFPSS